MNVIANTMHILAIFTQITPPTAPNISVNCNTKWSRQTYPPELLMQVLNIAQFTHPKGCLPLKEPSQ